MGGAPETGVVSGQRAVRELLGVRMSTVRELVEFDTSRGSQVFVRGRRGVVRALEQDVWRLYRDWVAECGEGVTPQ